MVIIVRFFLNNGVGQNLTAAAIGLGIGWLYARAKLQTLHARHDQHTEHLERVGRSLIDLHEKADRNGLAIEALHQRVTQPPRAARAARAPARRTPPR